MDEVNKDRKKEYGDVALGLHEEIETAIDESIKNNNIYALSAIEKKVGTDS